jgi:trigger factor
MQVSVETTSNIERRMTIGVPAQEIDQAVQKRLQETARSVRLNGFRPGKVPMSVVKRRFGDRRGHARPLHQGTAGAGYQPGWLAEV